MNGITTIEFVAQTADEFEYYSYDKENGASGTLKIT